MLKAENMEEPLSSIFLQVLSFSRLLQKKTPKPTLKQQYTSLKIFILPFKKAISSITQYNQFFAILLTYIRFIPQGTVDKQHRTRPFRRSKGTNIPAIAYNQPFDCTTQDGCYTCDAKVTIVLVAFLLTSYIVLVYRFTT